VRPGLGRSPPLIDAGLFPELAGGLDRIDASVLPPGCFVADAVHQPVMNSTERDRELVAGLATEGPWLHVPKVMRIRRLAAAHEAGLLGDIAKVFSIAIATRRSNGEDAFVDAVDRRRVAAFGRDRLLRTSD